VRVRLIEPASPGTHVYSKVPLPRLGLPMIGAALAQQGHDVSIYVGDLAPIDWDDVYASDVVGLSTITATALETYRLADQIRARGIPTVIGGPHATFMADETLGHADYVARGEGGDQLLPELIAALEEQRPFDSILGLSYRENGIVRHNPTRPPATDLDSLPVPDLSLVKGHEKMRYTPVMTSLGCPFDCRFCSVTAMFGRKFRCRTPESVILELERKRPKRVFFYDDNLAADRNRLKTMLTMIIERGLRFRWTAQVRTDVTRDPELLELMRRSGCWMVFLGLESVNQATLNGYQKSQSVDDIVGAVRRLHEHHIKVHGMFVLGADSDGPDVVRDTVDFALRNKIDTIMLNILTPLPGTPLFDEMDAEGSIVSKRWEYYDALHVVYRPKRMTAYRLHEEVMRGYSRFYGFRRWLGSLVAFHFTQLVFQTWGRSLRRAWSRDRRNKEYLAALKRLPPAHA